MRLAITGASGFVGRQIVPLLAAHGVDLLLVGRDPDALRRDFPGCRACGYAELEVEARGFDALLHLAVRNNDRPGTLDEFTAVNVDLVCRTLAASRRANIKRFVNVSSIHALRPGAVHPYAASKRAAAERLDGEAGVVTLFLPPVYGTEWGGRLAVLNRLPKPLARLLHGALAALRPTLDVTRLASLVMSVDGAEPRLVVSDGQEGNRVYAILSRAGDLAFAVGTIVVFWWLLGLLWLAIRLSSPGPAIFAQRRVGRDGAAFICLKFRTMIVGTAEVGTHEAPANAVTWVGRFVRRAKLDELPQVVNVLRREVAVVGPRPCLPVQTALVAARRRRGVLALTPGITGLAQVNGVDMSDPERLARWDSHYRAMRSLLLDLRIALATVRRPRPRHEVVPGVVPPRLDPPGAAYSAARIGSARAS
jgi:lipopolysaccharide/colanic/teichoic acid biosynthesis glycosyltransferase